MGRWQRTNTCPRRNALWKKLAWKPVVVPALAREVTAVKQPRQLCPGKKYFFDLLTNDLVLRNLRLNCVCTDCQTRGAQIRGPATV